MSRFAFILGHVSVLSSIEAKILIPDFAIESLGAGHMIAKSSSCDSSEVMRASGGLVKIAREYAEASQKDLAGLMVTAFQELVPSGKITFGISWYGKPASILGDRLAMQVKNILKEAGRAVRHVFSKEEALNSVTLLYNDFVKPGHVEVCLVPTTGNSLRLPLKIRGSEEGVMNHIDIFITEAFQDIGEYTELEKLLGARDDRSGVLPLRLVKMLLNIAGVQNEHIFLDPFCGSGILVGVAASRGVNNIIASDVSARAVQDSRKNLKNVIARSATDEAIFDTRLPLKVRGTKGVMNQKIITHPNPLLSQERERNLMVEQLDARELSKHIEPTSIDRIVTEPTLGPSNRAANPKEREELSKLYVDSFREFKKVLKPDGKILFIFPIFENELDFTRAQDAISQMGFRKVDLLQGVKQFFPGVSEPIYSRPQQRVRRLITMWEHSH